MSSTTASNQISLTRSGDPDQPLSRGVMVLSLDFELAWGTRGRPAAPRMSPFLNGTREACAGLLSLFADYEIPATWATVGALLMKTAAGTGRHPMLQRREFSDVPPGDSRSEPFWYAEDVVASILNCSTEQEIGCHTLTHLYVRNDSVGRAALDEELGLFRELFEENGLPRARSFIYPKGYIEHIDLLEKHGFYAFRGPESRWYESLPTTVIPAGLRVIDGKLGLTPRIDQPQHVSNRLWMIPASQFFSPFMSVGNLVSVEARTRKAIRGLDVAASRGGVFHLWTHPSNLGVRTDELLDGLRRILQHAAELRESGRLQIVSMGTLARELHDRLSGCNENPAVPADSAVPDN